MKITEVNTKPAPTTVAGINAGELFSYAPASGDVWLMTDQIDQAMHAQVVRLIDGLTKPVDPSEGVYVVDGELLVTRPR